MDSQPGEMSSIGVSEPDLGEYEDTQRVIDGAAGPEAVAGDGGLAVSQFCKYRGKPRRISVDHAAEFKAIQKTYKDSVNKALKNLNTGKLASQEYLRGDAAASQVSKGAPPLDSQNSRQQSKSILSKKWRGKDNASASSQSNISRSVNPHQGAESRYKHLWQVYNHDIDYCR